LGLLTLVHPREVFRTAILKNAVSIILVHNHPSQNSSPSSQDLNITEKIAKVGITLGIALVDHVIVTDSAYKSMKQLGLFTVHNFREGG
jgi:DNA repair protein RadC